MIKQAGPELDALVAEGVFGEPKPHKSPYELRQSGYPQAWLDRADTDVGFWYWVPRPFSTDISTVWLAIEKLKVDHIEPLIEWDEGDQEWYVHLSQYDIEMVISEPICDAHAPTAPHAICLAMALMVAAP